jgi:hypothetical protein
MRIVLALCTALTLVTPAWAQGGTSRGAIAGTDSAAVLVGAGDIASCDDLSGARGTAAIIERTPGTVMALGDLVYPGGSAEDFRHCYDPTWGRFRDRTRPAPGNHDFRSKQATPYFGYFGDAAGDPRKGYYSYELGAWHIIVLNSECGEAGGCDKGSPQVRWLREDLAAHPVRCTLAYWHKPLFSSGAMHGATAAVRPLWDALYDAGADLVINGHDHDYERFAPQNPVGGKDEARGIRQFVVGTGGKNLRSFRDPEPNSEVRDHSTFGVLELTLRPDSYSWKFIPAKAGGFSDAGEGRCH